MMIVSAKRYRLQCYAWYRFSAIVTMATNSLSKMIKSGLDVYAALPLLSACIGHKSLASTEGYVRLTCEYYPELLKQCASLNEFVYPQHDETD